MATSGSFLTDAVSLSGGTMAIEFSWEASAPDIVNNQTTVTWKIKGSGTYPYRVMTGPVKVYINNGLIYSGYTDNSNRLSLAVGDVITSGSFVATHDANGAYSFTAAVNSSIYYIDVPENPHQNGSGSWSLDNIPRKSTLTSTGGTLGTQQSLTINKAAQSFTHTLTYTCGNASGNIAVKTSDAVVNWTPPYSLASQSTTTVLLSVTLTLSTYSGDTLIGSNTYTYNYVIPDNADTKPTFSIDMSVVHDLSSAFDDLYVQGKSKVRGTFSYVSGKYGATVSSYVFSVEGKSYLGSPATSDVLLQSGNITITAYVIDSRGFTSSPVYKYITVIPYSKPSVVPYTGLSSIQCFRSDAQGAASESGTYIHIKAGRQFSTVTSEGTQKNFCLLKYRYKQTESASYSGWTTLIAKNTASNVIDTIIGNVVTNANYTYDIQLCVEDDVGESSTADQKVFSQTITLHLGAGGKKVAIGKAAVSDNLFDVNLPTEFRSTTTFDCPLDVKNGSIELNKDGGLQNYGGFIDFHFNGSSDDYTSRIIEDASGKISIGAPNGVVTSNDAYILGNETVSGSLGVLGYTEVQTIAPKGNIIMGGYQGQTGEQSIIFSNPSSSANPHIAGMYGGNPASDVDLGMWDWLRGKSIFQYIGTGNGGAGKINLMGQEIKPECGIRIGTDPSVLANLPSGYVAPGRYLQFISPSINYYIMIDSTGMLYIGTQGAFGTAISWKSVVEFDS